MEAAKNIFGEVNREALPALTLTTPIAT